MINIRKMLLLSFISMSIVYYMFLPIEVIIKIIKNEYILMIFIVVFFFAYNFFRMKLSKMEILELVPNVNFVIFKNSILFFLVFQVFDYFYEDGFIGMISQWFLYFLFGVLAHILILSLNLYKNTKYLQ